MKERNMKKIQKNTHEEKNMSCCNPMQKLLVANVAITTLCPYCYKPLGE